MAHARIHYFPVAIFAVLFCYCLGGAAQAAMPPGSPGAIEYLVFENGMISLKAREVPLISLLQEIVASANIRIVTASKIQGDQLINADVQTQPLGQTLRLLLEGYNYLVCYYSDNSLKGLQLIAGSTFSPAGMEFLPFSKDSANAAAAAGNGGQSGRLHPGKVKQNVARSSQEWAGSNGLSPLDEQRQKQESFTEVANSRATPSSRTASGAGYKNAQDRTTGNPRAEEEWNNAGDFVRIEEDPVATEQAALQKNWKREDFLRYKIETLSKNIESGSSDMQYGYWIQRKDKKYVTHDRDLLEHYEKELATILQSI